MDWGSMYLDWLAACCRYYIAWMPEREFLRRMYSNVGRIDGIPPIGGI